MRRHVTCYPWRKRTGKRPLLATEEETTAIGNDYAKAINEFIIITVTFMGGMTKKKHTASI